VNKIQPLPDTPIVRLENFYFKREDLNPSGSVKDRAVVKQLKNAQKLGYKSVAISSSGNAAISLAYWTQNKNFTASVFVSPKTSKGKLAELKKLNCRLIITTKPIRDCFRFCKKNNAYNMRQSLDPWAVKGLIDLGKEIKKQTEKLKLERLKAIFFPVSSGTTLFGVGMGIKNLTVASYAIQPANHCFLSSYFDKNYQPEKNIVADALVAKIIPKKNEIINQIKKSRGTGLVVQNSKIIEAQAYLKKNNIKTSNEGALALAGAWKATEKGLISKSDQKLILLTGRWYQDDK
jgi:threonine synthase